MWALKNRTAYAAERNWTRDKDGIHWWLVAVKATFDLAPGGRLVLADEQPAPVLMPEYFGEPGQSSLRHDSDLLAMKPGTDVLVHAHAHAPKGRPTETVPVSLRFAQIRKVLLVHGERTYVGGVLGVASGRPQPFTTRPIRYELAFGGCDLSGSDPRTHRLDERNPIGRGFRTRNAHVVGKPACSLEYPEGDPAEKGPKTHGSETELPETPDTKASAQRLAQHLVTNKYANTTMLGVIHCTCKKQYANRSGVTDLKFCNHPRRRNGTAPTLTLRLPRRLIMQTSLRPRRCSRSSKPASQDARQKWNSSGWMRLTAIINSRPARSGRTTRSHCRPPTRRGVVPPPRFSCSSCRTTAAPLASPSNGFTGRRSRQQEKSGTTKTGGTAWSSSEARLTMAPPSHRVTPATSSSP